MLWLAACIVFTSFLIIAFKYFEKYQVKTIPAIAFNYLTCGTLGFLFQEDYSGFFQLSYTHTWVWLSIGLGLSFIVVFYLLGINTQINGITIGAISNKLSVVIPISIALIFYGDKFTIVKAIGILLALIAVVLTHIKPHSTAASSTSKTSWLLPFVVFIGSGITDSALNFIQKFYLPERQNELMIFFVFGSAATAGFIIAAYQYFNHQIVFGKKEMIAGFLLGLPNFGSMFTILKALQHSGLEHSVVWPINNVGIIVFSTFYSVLVFKEKLNLVNMAGIFVALAAIIMMSLS